MTRFLKRAHEDGRMCGGCALRLGGRKYLCNSIWKGRDDYPCGSGNDIFHLVPRPPDGTRCRDLDGNIKVVGVDV